MNNPLAQPYLSRLPRFQSPSGWLQIARSPSYFAPRAEDIQTPLPFELPSKPTLLDEEKAILHEPQRDDLRLALADRLDRQGNIQGTLIRTQVEIARALRNGIEPSVRLYDRERELLSNLIPKALEQLKPWGVQDVVFRRGMIEQLSLTGRSFITLGSKLFNFLPLRGVRLIAVAWFIKQLTEAEHSQFLEKLDLSDNRIGCDGLSRLVQPLWNHLTQLELRGNELGGDGLRMLNSARWRWQLRKLGLANNNITNLDAFIQDPAYIELDSLDISENRIGNRALSGLGQFSALKKLNLSNCNLTSLEGLFACSNAKSLRSLDLSFNEIESYQYLENHDWYSLSLRGNRIKPEKRLCLSFVRHLDLAANFLGKAVCSIVSQCKNLISLDLTNTLITDQDIEIICESPMLKSVRSLNLSWNSLTDISAKAILKSAYLKELRQLNISGTKISPKYQTVLSK